MQMKKSALIVLCFLAATATAVANHHESKINDAQIAAIVVTANQVDVDAGKLAAEWATHPEVKKFATTMVNDHSNVNKAAVDLVTKLGVTPEDNATAQSLKAGGEKNVAALKGLKGAEFDKAYIDHEIAYHKAVLEAVDKVLIPGASNADLKAMLVKVRPAFVAHLEHAQGVQAKLAGHDTAHGGKH
jgi:putative membrane protein